MNNPPFVFEDYRYDEIDHVASFRYSYGSQVFKEELCFCGTPDWQPRKLTDSELAILKKILRLLHLVAGISYFKAFLPDQIEVRGELLDETTASFLDHFYIHGLGEYAFRNGVSLGKIKFPVQKAPKGDVVRDIHRLTLPRRTAVPIGGGKDSIVTAEILKRANEPLVLFLVGNAQPQLETIKVAKLPYIHVQRTIDPKLFELNRRGAKNGHIPVTGIVSLIAVASAVVYGYDAVAMSNERSANVGNTIYDGIEVNHQYSKSLDFETRLSTYIENKITPDIRYFSFLRSLSEIGIARIFAGLTDYHSVFRSCGAAYRQDPARRLKNWCGTCDKCRFVFLALAPFIPKERLTLIFGKNLLNDKNQIAEYRALTGLAGHKPFECIGEIAESAAVILRLSEMAEWKNDAVVGTIHQELIRSTEIQGLNFETLFIPTDEHRVPPFLLKVLQDHLEPLRAHGARCAA